MIPTCNDGALLNSCQYKSLGNGCFYCNYYGYCDFQRPRDSRNYSYTFIYPNEETNNKIKENK